MLLGVYLCAYFFGIHFWMTPFYKDIYLTHVFKWLTHCMVIIVYLLYIERPGQIRISTVIGHVFNSTNSKS